MEKIMFIIPSLVDGGAEKVLIDLISTLNSDRYELFLILFEKKGVHLQAVPHYVKIIDLGKKSRLSFLKLILGLGLHLKKIKPDTVISFMEYANLITISAKILSRENFNFIVTVHTYLSRALKYLKFRDIRKFVITKLYNIPNHIVVPSIGVQQDLVSEFRSKKNKILVIPHPIIINAISASKEESIENIGINDYILATGRLTRPKGYPFLIKAYSLISKEITNDLVILGVGEEESNLKKMVINLGLQKRVHFLGYQENPYKFMRNASLFVLSSLWESFAIVLTEAMACGVPIISTDCPSGPGEIITNGKNGTLVPPADEKALADSMLKLLADEDLRRKFSDEGKRNNIFAQFLFDFLFRISNLFQSLIFL